MNPGAESLPTWDRRRVLVTGATGFVGGWLADALVRRGAAVMSLLRPGESPRPDAAGIEWIRASVEDVDAVRAALGATRPEAVFHLAANNDNLCRDSTPAEIFETNTRGTWNLLEACRGLHVEAIVIASSIEAESLERTATAGAEAPMTRPYAASKRAAELVARSYVDTCGLPVAVARCENVYGGRDFNWNRLIPGVVRSLLSGETPTLRSSGSLLRDYLYVDDVIDAYIRLAGRAARPEIRGGVFRFASGVRTPVRDVVKELCGVAGFEGGFAVSEDTAPERVDAPYGSEREHSLLGWSPATRLATGLRTTYEWYRDHLGGRPLR